MKNIVIVGAGSVGKAAARAVLNSPDMRLCGFIRRSYELPEGFPAVPTAFDVSELPEKPHGAIICVPSRFAKEAALPLLEQGIATADCFDIHDEIFELRNSLNGAALKGGCAAVTGAGWDPGLDSAIRTLLLAAAPQGVTYTNFGPGMSMGHSAAARAVSGVKNAVSITLPLGFGKHIREVYVEAEEDACKAEIKKQILSDGYFKRDETAVYFVDEINSAKNTGHGVSLCRFGSAAGAGNQNFKFEMSIENPALTGQLLVSAVRAAFKEAPGAYLFPEIAPAKLLFNFENNPGLI